MATALPDSRRRPTPTTRGVSQPVGLRACLRCGAVVGPDWDALREAFFDAVDQTALIVCAPEVRQAWDRSSVLAEMTVGMLVAHVVQMLGGLVAFLKSDPPDSASVKVCSVQELYGVAARLERDRGLD